MKIRRVFSLLKKNKLVGHIYDNKYATNVKCAMYCSSHVRCNKSKYILFFMCSDLLLTFYRVEMKNRLNYQHYFTYGINSKQGSLSINESFHSYITIR